MADSQGRIFIQFTTGVANNPKLSGIEVQRADTTGESISAVGDSFQATAGQSASFDVGSISASGYLSGAQFTATINWGDGQASDGVVQANPAGGLTILGNHQYATEGLYVTTVELFDRTDKISEVIRGTANVAAAPQQIVVSVAYYDDEHANAVLPNPWNGSPNVTFWGGTTDGLYDGGAILIQNTSNSPVVIGPGLSADNFANRATFQIWDSFIGSGFTLAPGQSVIATQTAGRDFDTSDTPIVNDPSQRNFFTPSIHISVNGQALTYLDAAQVLNAGGFDPGQSEGVSESAPWQLVGQVPQKAAASASASGSTVTTTSTAVPASGGGGGNGAVAPASQPSTVAIAPLTVETRGAPGVAAGSKIRRSHIHDLAHRPGHIRTASRHPRGDVRAWAARALNTGQTCASSMSRASVLPQSR